ncbi:MAG: hypothetical protein ACKO0Z_20840 [Betaproteobacteria bacterium]
MNEQVQTVVLSLPLQAVEVIMAGLGKLPLETSLAVHQHIANEVNRQLQEAQAKAATPKEVQDAKL